MEVLLDNLQQSNTINTSSEKKETEVNVSFEKTLASVKNINHRFIKNIEDIGLLDKLNKNELEMIENLFDGGVVTKDELLEAPYEELSSVFNKFKKEDMTKYIESVMFISNITSSSTESMNQLNDMVFAITYSSNDELNNALFTTMSEIDNEAQRLTLYSELSLNLAQYTNNEKINSSFTAEHFSKMINENAAKQLEESFDLDYFIDLILENTKEMKERTKNINGSSKQYGEILDSYSSLKENLLNIRNEKKVREEQIQEQLSQTANINRMILESA